MLRKLAISMVLLTVVSLNGESLGPAERTVTIPRDFSNQPLPRYKNGFALAYDFERAVVWSFDQTGKLVTEAPVTLPGASKVIIRDVAATTEGVLAVSAGGSGDSGIVSAIVWIDPAGKTIRVVRTSPFAAFRVAFASDGTLWAVGRVRNANFENEPNHDILRQYDSQGRLLRTMLPSGSFSVSNNRHPAARSFLTTSSDRIGIYCETAKEWVEVSLTGAILGRWKTMDVPPDCDDLVGAAMTPSGGVYFSTQRLQKSGSKQPDGIARTQLFRLDKPTGAFLPVDSAQVVPPGRVAIVLGSDGDHLVFYTKSVLSWVRAE